VPFPRVASSAGNQDMGHQGHLHQRSSEDRSSTPGRSGHGMGRADGAQASPRRSPGDGCAARVRSGSASGPDRFACSTRTPVRRGSPV
jgi:hypothetical protein